MKSNSLPIRAAKVALLFGLVLGANASNLNPRIEAGGQSGAPIKSMISATVDAASDAASHSDGGSLYSILAGLGFMGAIVLRRKTSNYK